VLKTQISILFGNNDKLSEQETLECIKKGPVLGCDGGWEQAVFNWAEDLG
jgi:hypothetical protein